MEISKHKPGQNGGVPVGLQVVEAGRNRFLVLVSPDLMQGYIEVGDYLKENTDWVVHSFSVTPAALPSALGQPIPAFAFMVVCHDLGIAQFRQCEILRS